MAKVIVFSPHADDEVISMGGTIINYLKSGKSVHVVYLFPKKELVRVADLFRQEAPETGLFSYEVVFREEFEGRIDRVSKRDLVSLFDRILDREKPETVYIPFKSHHQDHVMMNNVAIASLRNSVDNPDKHFVKNVYLMCPESLWAIENFRPGVYQDISNAIDKKLELMKAYNRQSSKYNNHLEITIKGSAAFYGSQVDVEYAEPFEVMRMIARECA